MKFTDGFWVIKPGVTMYNAVQVQDSRWINDKFVVYCSHIPLNHRGQTLNAPLITLNFHTPREGVIALNVEHFQGSAQKLPAFELQEDGSKPNVKETPDQIVLQSGSLSAVVQKDNFRLDFYENGKRLTGLGNRHLGFATTSENKYIRVKLDIGVGEKIYGLGERFTPFVKNGQSVDIWNEDGGTASELAYKNIPFYITNRNYGVFVNSPGKVSYELCSEAVQSAQFSLPGNSLEFMVIGGGSMKQVICHFTALTGRPALPPAWSFGLWLTTSFTTDYNEETILSFVDGMKKHGIPLHVFHFDCFWMKAYEWCNFTWDSDNFKEPEMLLADLHQRGLKTCVWINPYIAQKSPLFIEGKEKGYFLKRTNGDVWQWDMWQAGMALVDFTNPKAKDWYAGKLKILLDQGVDSFKTDFGERIPTDCVYFDGSDPETMHNYYTLLYNRTVFELLERERGIGEACLFARSATVGGQQYPVHWGGDSSSSYPSMAESLRAGLSLLMSGFAFWSHDISGFEDTATEDVYIRWAQFGLLSSHSRLHGSSSYRVPWLFGEQAPRVVRKYTQLKCRLMPYLYSLAVSACQTGLPTMRAMVMEFPDDRSCEDLDLQYMLGESMLVAPIFRVDHINEAYLPEGRWTHFFSNKVHQGGRWHKDMYTLDDMPLFIRENSILPIGSNDCQVDYNYLEGLEVHLYEVNKDARCQIVDSAGKSDLTIEARREGSQVHVLVDGRHQGLMIVLHENGETRQMKLESDMVTCTI